MKNYKGFTLMESLLVLLVVSAMLSLPYLTFRKWQERMAAAYFFNEFEAYYHRTQLSAVISSMQCTIHATEKEIIFSYSDSKAQQQQISLPFPSKVDTKAKFSILFNGISGNTGDMKTLKFSNLASKETVIYTIQLGSGKLVKKTEKL